MKKINKFLVSFLTIFIFSVMIAVAATALRPSGGGTGNVTSPTKGTLLAGSSTTAYGVVPVGTNGKVLTASSGAPYGIAWETATGGSSLATSSATSTGYFANWVGNGLLSIISNLWQSSSTGNVGIGTTGPGTKLEVVGVTSSTEIRTASTTGGVGYFTQLYDSSATSTRCETADPVTGLISAGDCVVSLNNLNGNVIATGTTAQIAVSSSSGNLVFSLPATINATNLNLSGTLGVSSTITQTGGLVSIASTTITGNATTTSLTVTGVTTHQGAVNVSSTLTVTNTSTFQGNVLITPTSTFLATDSTGKIIATSTPSGGSASFTILDTAIVASGTGSYTVPIGVTSLRVYTYGANGGSDLDANGGGKGGRTGATIATTPGKIYYYAVGGGGGIASTSTGGTAGYNGGGVGGNSSIGFRAGGGGGGWTWFGASSTVSTSTMLLAAGGGGGGTNTAGSGGGGLTGVSNCSTTGATQTAGGIGANAGTSGQGGAGQNGGSWGGAGGGGGLFGGGGGYADNNGGNCASTGDPGGGGSGFVSTTSTVTNASTTQGTGTGGVNAGANGQILIFLLNYLSNP